MGPTSSKRQRQHSSEEWSSPFGRTQHSPSCPGRKLVEMRDFVLFIGELKRILRQAVAAASVTDGSSEASLSSSAASPSEDRDPVSESLERQTVLPYKVTINNKEQNFLYVKCHCPGKYIGMDINQVDGRGQTALHAALRKKERRIVDLLLSTGADQHKHNKWGLTPLHVACEIGDLDIVAKLLSMGADPNANERQDLKMFFDQCRTPLIIAASHGHAECVTAVLKAGADMSHVDFNGNTALHKACIYGHSSCARALLMHGADPNARNSMGATPLQLTLLQQHNDIARQLLDANCSVKTYTEHLPSVVTLAAAMGEYDVLKRCVDSNQDLDVPDHAQRTPLYYTFTGDARALRSTYSAVGLGQGLTVQYSQLRGRRTETFRLLVDRGVNVEQMLCLAIKSNALTVKHFTLPQNVELFRVAICACGFEQLSDNDLDVLFWRLVGSNSGALITALLKALPRLDKHVRRKLRDVTDWTGARTRDAILRYLENAGASMRNATWVDKVTRQPRALREWCRQAIRRNISCNVLHRAAGLPLPVILKHYVMLAETGKQRLLGTSCHPHDNS